MPKRTNDFQNLVDLVYSLLKSAGAKITGSALRPDGTGAMREIDALIEEPDGDRRLRVVIEAKDLGRVMDIKKFGEIIEQYLSVGCVPNDKTIVVTRRGFAKTVVKRVALFRKQGYDVELCTFDRFDGKQVKHWATHSRSRLYFLEPEIHIQSISPIPNGCSLDDFVRKARVLNDDGKKAELFADYLEGRFYRNVLRTYKAELEWMRTRSGHSHPPVLKCAIDDLNVGWKLGREQGRIVEICFLLRWRSSSAPMNLAPWQLTSVEDCKVDNFMVGTGELRSGQLQVANFEMAMKRQNSGSTGVVLKMNRTKKLVSLCNCGHNHKHPPSVPGFEIRD